MLLFSVIPLLIIRDVKVGGNGAGRSLQPGPGSTIEECSNSDTSDLANLIDPSIITHRTLNINRMRVTLYY